MKKLFPYYLKISFLDNIESVVHLEVMDEMEKRGYNVSPEWRDKNYRGKNAENYSNLEEKTIGSPIYKEHNPQYLAECIENLRKKGILLEL